MHHSTPDDSIRVILVRHGETYWNAERRMQGHLDSELTPRGLAQAASLELLLADEPISAVWMSDLGRCRETARLILGKRFSCENVPLYTDERLRELHLGDFQGLMHNEAKALDPVAWRGFSTYDPDCVMPRGESRGQCLERVLYCLEDAVNTAQAQPGRDPEASILVVTHGGVLNMFLRHVLGIPFNAPRRFAVPNGTLNRFQFQSGHWRMVTWGETHPHIIERPTAKTSELSSGDIG